MPDTVLVCMNKITLTAGYRFSNSRLRYLDEAPGYRRPGGDLCRRVKCVCDCGKIKEYDFGCLRNGNPRSCGCLQEELRAASRTEISPGDRFGRLKVLREVDPIRYPSGQLQRRILCVCDCKRERTVLLHNLRSGATKGCSSCLHKTHGASGSGEYTRWQGAKARCFNTNTEEYRHYGGRGITMCDRWKNSFPTFLADMGPLPSPYHQLDRIDPDGNYEPGNCRWLGTRGQVMNRRNSVPPLNQKLFNEIREWMAAGFPAMQISKQLDIPLYSVRKVTNIDPQYEEYLHASISRNES
jgi:hypothetical protein